MKYTIYLRTNKVNGKQYVGQTKDFKRREREWENLLIRYANKLITKERAEFGLDNFKTEILAVVETQDEAWELEKKYIKNLNTKYPNGYNMTFGGEDFEGKEVTEEQRIKISNTLVEFFKDENNRKKLSESHKGQHSSPATEFKKGNTPWIKGKKHSIESIEKMKQSHKGHTPWNKGKKGYMDEETKRKISEANKERNSTPIIQIKDNKIIDWKSATECVEKCPQYKYTCIRYASKGKYSIKKGHKYKDSMWYTKSDYEKNARKGV